MNSTLFHSSKSLKLSETKEQKNCPFCGELKNKSVAIEENIENGGKWLQCLNCGLSYISHMPKPEALNEYYQNYYSAGTDEKTTIDDLNRLSSRIYQKAKLKKFESSSKLRILDWGGGDGEITLHLVQQYFSATKAIDVVNVDYHASKVNKTKIPKNTEYTACSTLVEAKGKFDVVICSAILEHVPNIKENLDILFSSLDEAGVIYFRTPYMLPFKKLLPTKVDMTYPAHVFDIGYEFYRHIKDKYNLKTIYLGPSIIETTIAKNPTRTITAFLMKLPFQVLGENWHFVGGCEFIATKQ